MLMQILIYIVIFTILYATITANVSFIKNLIIYILCCEVDLALRVGGMSFALFLLSFGIYFFSGIILLSVLQKVRDSAGMKGFIITGIIVQILLDLLIGFLA